MGAVLELHTGDAFEWLAALADQAPESVDLIITDPPYESLEKHRSKGTTTRLSHSKASSNDWFKTIPNERLPELMRLLYAVLKKNRHCYLFCDAETMFVLKPAGEAAGFKFWKPIVWDKVAIGMGYHYRARYEFVLFFEKGKRKLNDLAVPDVLEFKRLRGDQYYPTEKPEQLMRLLVMQSTEPGELVIDPFMGSGVVGTAALAGKCDFAGCDLNPESIERTQKRLSR